MLIVAQVDSTYTYDTIPIYPFTHPHFLDHWQLLPACFSLFVPPRILLLSSRIGCAWRAVFLSSPCFPFVTQNVCLPKVKYESKTVRTKPENWKIVHTIAGLESFQFFQFSVFLHVLSMFLYICDLFWSIVCRFLYGLRTSNVSSISLPFFFSFFPLPPISFTEPCLFMVLILVVFHSIKYPTNSSRKLHMSTHTVWQAFSRTLLLGLSHGAPRFS